MAQVIFWENFIYLVFIFYLSATFSSSWSRTLMGTKRVGPSSFWKSSFSDPEHWAAFNNNMLHNSEAKWAAAEPKQQSFILKPSRRGWNGSLTDRTRLRSWLELGLHLWLSWLRVLTVRVCNPLNFSRFPSHYLFICLTKVAMVTPTQQTGIQTERRTNSLFLLFASIRLN